MSEHHIDDLDRAAALTDAHNQAAVAKIQQQAKPQQVQNEDGTWPTTECVDCGDSIPEPRLKMGRIKCVACQTKDEQQRRMYAN